MLGTMTRTEALKSFFTSAAAKVMKGVSDPAGHSGEIAPSLKRRQARDLFQTMADLAATAEAWAKSGYKHGEDIAVYYLRLIFGKKFPKPSRDRSDIEFDPWWCQAPWGNPEYLRKTGDRPDPPWEWPPNGGRAGPGDRPGGPQGPGPGAKRGDKSRRPDDKCAAPRRPQDGSLGGKSGNPDDGPHRPDGWFGGDPSGPHDRSPGGAAAGGHDAGVVPKRAPTGEGRSMPSPSEATASGTSLRNPNGHRAAMPATPVAAPPAPRPEDPAG
jgi:hypothetical protein